METADSHPLPSLVPVLVRRRLAAPASEPLNRTIDSAVLVVDVSGFTQLVADLAPEGDAGAERLSGVLDAFVGRLTDLFHTHGGDVWASSGDALMACWPDHASADAVVLAARCARAVRAELHGHEAAPGIVLSVKAALGAGSVTLLEVGGVDGRWIPVLVGEAVDQAVRCEDEAEAGDVLASPEAAELLAGSADLDLTGRRHHIRGVHDTAPVAPIASPSGDSVAVEAAKPLVLPLVADRIEAGGLEWLAEFRTVTVVFAAVAAGFDGSGSLEALQELVHTTQTELARLEGSLVGIDTDDKGTVLLVAFGLPAQGHEDDAVRALHAAAAVDDAANRAGLRVRIGVTTGGVFAGVVGGDRRRVYSLIGPPVVIAAGLSQVAGEGVLCDTATAESAGTRFDFETASEVTLKGRDQPVAVHRPVGSHHPDRAAEPGSGRLIGRDHEREQVRRAVAAAATGTGSVVVVEGEAGIGKSRILEEAVDAATRDDVRLLKVTGDAIERHTPYGAWQPLLASLLGWTADESAARLAACLETAGARELAPLVARVLDVELPETATTEGLTGDARAEATRSVLADLLGHASRELPLVVVVEDAHWLDSLSWALLAYAARRGDAIAFVVASRPPEDDAPMAQQQLFADPATIRLQLGTLEEGQVVEFVLDALRVDDMPAEVADLLSSRGGGHPFFTRELAHALVDAGAITTEGRRCRLAVDRDALDDVLLPDTIEGVVTSRLDRLPARQQLSLKVASVFGEVFAEADLAAVHPVPDDVSRIPVHLQSFDRLGLAHLMRPGGDPAWAFSHALVRDVAYEHLTFDQRRRVHRAIGTRLEQAGGTHVSLLAHHWSRGVAPSDASPDIAAAIRYLRDAAIGALSASAHTEAASHLKVALELVGWLPSGADRDRTELATQSLYGYALMNMRGYGDPEVEAAYRRAHELAPDAARTTDLGPVLYGLFSFLASRGEYPSASAVADQLLALGRDLDDPAITLVGENAQGLCSVLRGHLDDGAEHCRRSAEAADRDPSLDVLSQYGGDFRGYPRAWLAIADCLLGRAATARAVQEEGLAATEWQPYTHAFVLAFAGLDQLRRDHDAVRRRGEALRDLASRYGFAMLGAIAEVFLAWEQAVSNQSREAADRLEGALAVPRYVALHSFLPWYLALLAEARSASGDVAAARQAVDEGLALCRDAGGSFYEAELWRLAAELDAAAGAPVAEVDATLQTGIDVARAQGARWWELRLVTTRAALLGSAPSRADVARVLAAVDADPSEPVVVAAREVSDAT